MDGEAEDGKCDHRRGLDPDSPDLLSPLQLLSALSLHLCRWPRGKLSPLGRDLANIILY